MPDTHRHYDDDRVDLVIDDVNNFVEIHSGKFDVIFLDIPDFGQDGPVGSISFLAITAKLNNLLNDMGLILCQTSVPFFGNEKIARSISEEAKQLGFEYKFFGTLSPMFPGGFQTFVALGNQTAIENLTNADIEKNFWDIGLYCEFCNPKIHMAAFAFAEAVLNERRVVK